jgi:hypothetical protein
MAWHLELPKFLRTHKATGAAWDLMNEIPWTDTALLVVLDFSAILRVLRLTLPYIPQGLNTVSPVTSKQDFNDVATGSFVKLPIAHDRGASIGLFEVTGDCSHIIN